MADLSTIRPSWGEGNIKLASPITVGANAALDDRLVVDTYDSLYAAGTFTSIYPGMAVATKDTGDIYVYVGPKALEGSQTASNWKKVGDNSTVTADLTQVKKDVAANTTAINTEVADRKKAITDEVTARNTAITAAIELLDATVTKADKGVSVKIVEENGVIKDTSAVTVTPGTIGGATDGNVVTGAVVKAYVDKAVASTYKVKGGVDEYSKLPTNAVEGDVYNVKAAFTLDFDKKPYPAGTNVVWVAATGSGDAAVAAHWDALGGTIDLSIYKEKQSAVSVTGAVSSTITALSQDANGKITATVKNIQIESRQVTDLDDDLADLSSRITTAQNTANTAKTTAEAAVPKTTTVNGKALSTNITIGATDIAHGLTGTNVIKTASPNTTVKTALSDLDAKAKTDSDRITALENKTVSGVVTGITAVDKNSGDPITLNGTIGFDYDSEEQEIKFTTTNKVIFAEIIPSSIAKEKLEGTIQTTLEKADSALQPENITGSSRNYISVSVNKLESGNLQISTTPSVSTNIVAASTGQLADAKAVKNYVDTKTAGAVTSALTWEVI